ncbi:hypothetical protein [Paenibacillus sp. 23TSA30-6]|uniref:hypothetical protein n=1 Tax=Paenibacillus sp. 23TSA30-6 TaxID=2546104 RepID=UPI001787ACFD|nr:hypothetical protein [Paenibacillus sp. 23TSA30-6]MBE0335567.1 hypothetical protein [Paenibacillus sp. 23TSA30-6]
MTLGVNVVSSFERNGKIYVTLEIDGQESNETMLRSGIKIGDFKIEVNRSGDQFIISLYYGSHKIKDWNISIPENACVSLGDESFEILGFEIKLKNIQICLEGLNKVCFKAEVYIKVPIIGERKLGDINVCS